MENVATNEIESQIDTHQNEEGVSKDIPVEYIIPGGFGLLYSDAVFVQHTEHDFVLSFFQHLPPIIQTKEDLEKTKKLEAVCVSRIVVTPKQMEHLVNALKSNLEKYQNKFNKKEGQ